MIKPPPTDVSGPVSRLQGIRHEQDQREVEEK